MAKGSQKDQLGISTQCGFDKFVLYNFGTHLELLSELSDAVDEDLDAVRDGPHLLVTDEADLDVVGLGSGQVVEVQRHRRPPLGPELVHRQEILDVVVEQLVEDHFCVVAGIDGPLTRRDSNDAAVVDLFRLFAVAVGGATVTVRLKFQGSVSRGQRHFFKVKRK